MENQQNSFPQTYHWNVEEQLNCWGSCSVGTARRANAFPNNQRPHLRSAAIKHLRCWNWVVVWWEVRLECSQLPKYQLEIFVYFVNLPGWFKSPYRFSRVPSIFYDFNVIWKPVFSRFQTYIILIQSTPSNTYTQ